MKVKSRPCPDKQAGSLAQGAEPGEPHLTWAAARASLQDRKGRHREIQGRERGGPLERPALSPLVRLAARNSSPGVATIGLLLLILHPAGAPGASATRRPG